MDEVILFIQNNPRKKTGSLSNRMGIEAIIHITRCNDSKRIYVPSQQLESMLNKTTTKAYEGTLCYQVPI